MAIASGINTKLTYIIEAAHGTTPNSPTLKILRSTSRNINPTIDGLETAELRSDRQVSDLRHGFNQVGGSLGFELSIEAYDDMIEGVMSEEFAAITTGSVSLEAIAPNQFKRASGTTFKALGLRKGDVITTTGFSTSTNNSANNSEFRISGISTDGKTITITTPTTSIVNNADAASRTLLLVGKRVDIGTTLKTFTFERSFTDLTKFQVFRGCTVNTMEMSIQPGAIVGGTLGISGMSFSTMGGSTIGTGTDTPAATNSPLSSFDGAMFEGGTTTAVVTGLDFSLDNGRSLEAVVGSKFSPDVFEGTARVTGTLSAFFESEVLLNKFINETESSLYVRLNDPDGTNFINIVIPRIKYTGGEIDPPQQGPMPISMPFTALVDTYANHLSATSLSIQRSNT